MHFITFLNKTVACAISNLNLIYVFQQEELNNQDTNDPPNEPYVFTIDVKKIVEDHDKLHKTRYYKALSKGPSNRSHRLKLVQLVVNEIKKLNGGSL